MFFSLKTEPAAESFEFGSSDPNLWGNLFLVFFSLLFILILIVAVSKYLARKNRYGLANRAVKLLGGVSLGPNKSLQIVEVGNSLYLIGVGENIQLIDKVDDAEEVEWIKTHMEQAPGLGNISFAKLKSMLQPGSSKREDEDEAPGRSFSDIFQQKMTAAGNRSKSVEELLKEHGKGGTRNDQDA